MCGGDDDFDKGEKAGPKERLYRELEMLCQFKLKAEKLYFC